MVVSLHDLPHGLRPPADEGIYNVAPAGSTIVKGVPITAKVGHSITVDGVELGLIAATHYNHNRRAEDGLVVAVVPRLLFWHLSLQNDGKIKGRQRSIPAEQLPCHDPPSKRAIEELVDRLYPGSRIC